MLLAAVLGVIAGGLIPIQTAINTRLSIRLGAVLPASLISFAVGTAGLAVAVRLTGTSIPWVSTATGQPWWIWIGGVCGLVFLSLNIVLMPRLGASATVVLPLVGQVLGGVLIDAVGAFGVAERPFTVVRGIGATLVVGGAVMVNLMGRPAASATTAATPHHEHPGRPPLALWLVGVMAGVLGAVQTAVNGRLGEVMGSGLAAATVSFLIGTLGLALVVVATRQRIRRTGDLPAWLFTGGLLGATFVLVNALNAPILGTSLTVSVVLLGQVTVGLAMDHYGWVGVRRRPVTWPRLVGAALVMLGVVLVRVG